MLTDFQIKRKIADGSCRKVADAGGLYLELSPSGGKHWRYRFRLEGKENLFAIGQYPDTSIAEARILRDKARLLVKQGINPASQRKLDKLSEMFERETTFESVADEWYTQRSDSKHAKPWSEGYKSHIRTILKKDVYPRIGVIPIKDIKTPMVYDVLRKIELRQAPTRAILARQTISAVFNHACMKGHVVYNIVVPLAGQIARCVVEHRKHLKRDDLPDFLRALEDYSGHVTTTIALKLLLLTAVRPGELCGAMWSEFNIEKAEWIIPGSRMKMKVQHVVPLPTQALALLEQLRDQTGHGKQLFPTQGTKSTTMPTATLRNAIAKMGFIDRFSPHGARGTFSTMANEAGFRSDVIERQLAHGERNAVRAAYNQAEYLPERRIMMQQYADTLDALKAGATIIPFGKAA